MKTTLDKLKKRNKIFTLHKTNGDSIKVKMTVEVDPTVDYWLIDYDEFGLVLIGPKGYHLIPWSSVSEIVV